jgi:hypothetical protein
MIPPTSFFRIIGCCTNIPIVVRWTTLKDNLLDFVTDAILRMFETKVFFFYSIVYSMLIFDFAFLDKH